MFEREELSIPTKKMPPKEINQKALAKEERLIGFRHRIKQYKQNRYSQKEERKFYHQVGTGMCEDIPTTES